MPGSRRLAAGLHSPITGRGSPTCAPKSPTSSPTTGWRLCSTRIGDLPQCLEPTVRRDDRGPSASRWTARSLTLEPTLPNLMQDPREDMRPARRPQTRSPRRSGPICGPVHADHQHARQGQGNLRPLARLCRRGRCAPPRQSRRTCDRRCSGRGGREPPIRASLHRYYRLKAKWFGKVEPRPLGSQRAACPTPLADKVYSLGRRRATRCSLPTAAFHRAWPVSRNAFSTTDGSCSGPARQGARRLCASDGAVGASLCAAQLSRQAARRDDARPRARPWRASGARRTERRADGADAFDARRNGLRLRRDADLPGAARHRRTGRGARCSPPRSRTC